jgi:hypothetical protein
MTVHPDPHKLHGKDNNPQGVLNAEGENDILKLALYEERAAAEDLRSQLAAAQAALAAATKSPEPPAPAAAAST